MINSDNDPEVFKSRHGKDRYDDLILFWSKVAEWTEEQFVILCICENQPSSFTPSLRSTLESWRKNNLDYDFDLGIKENITDRTIPFYPLLIQPICDTIGATEYKKHKNGAAPIWWIEQANKTEAGIHVPESLKEAVLSSFNETVQRSKCNTQPNNLHELTEIQSNYIASNAIGKLAIEAATELELKSERRASAKQVMELLQKWADEGVKPSYLKMANKSNRSVKWITEKGKERDYTSEACQRTLEKWNKGRQ